MTFWGDLQRRLAKHTPWNDTEAELVGWLQEAIRNQDISVCRSDCSIGHITASVLLLDSSLQHIALVEHPVFGWIQPGGHIEAFDSTVLAAAQREAEEETGVVSRCFVEPALLDVTAYRVPESLVKSEAAHQHFDLRFVMVARDSEPAPQQSQVRWLTIAEASRQVNDPSVRLGLDRVCSRLLGVPMTDSER